MDVKTFPLLIAMMGLALIIVGGVLYSSPTASPIGGTCCCPCP